MIALETIAFALGVMVFAVATLLFMMGGPTYRSHDRRSAPRRRG